MDYKESYLRWLKYEKIDESSKSELKALSDDEIKERFCKDLEFGTGGLRGIIGAGTNRINIYTVRKATQGLANFIKKNRKEAIPGRVAIAYDSRHFSELFAEEVALVLAANGIKALLFDTLKPTPILSFAVRYLMCDAGIVITASHNPPQYNGYKVYGPDGGQITLSMAESIIKEINRIDIFNDVISCNKNEAIRGGLFSYIGAQIDQEYTKKVLDLSIHPETPKYIENFKVVYTPLHGTGLQPIQTVLSKLGYKEIFIVESQKKPDGDFPTVKSPNPEEREALTEGIKLAESIKADIVLGTDPDADRVGVAVLDKEGIYVLLTGNQIGALLTHYIVSNKKFVLNEDAVVKTIVTSELGANIARKYGATVFDTLTGFKFIGEKIQEFDTKKDFNFLFGYEESYGYLAGTFVRDKDAVIATSLIVEMAAFYKIKNKTLLNVMDEIYEEHGYYTDALESFTFDGVDGQIKINLLVDQFRDTNEISKNFSDLVIIEDYKLQKKINIKSKHVENIDLPKSNVLKFHFLDDSWFAIRPSGTEPKLKIYYSTVAEDEITSKEKMIELKLKIAKIIFRD